MQLQSASGPNKVGARTPDWDYQSQPEGCMHVAYTSEVCFRPREGKRKVTAPDLRVIFGYEGRMENGKGTHHTITESEKR